MLLYNIYISLLVTCLIRVVCVGLAELNRGPHLKFTKLQWIVGMAGSPPKFEYEQEYYWHIVAQEDYLDEMKN